MLFDHLKNTQRNMQGRPVVVKSLERKKKAQLHSDNSPVKNNK